LRRGTRRSQGKKRLIRRQSERVKCFDHLHGVATMITRFKHHQRVKSKAVRRPAFDWLEPKLVLNGSIPSVAVTTIHHFNEGSTTEEPLGQTLTVVGVDSKLGTTIQAKDVSFTINFDRPVDPGSLASDFLVDQVDTSGNMTPVDSLGFTITETPSDDGLSIIVSTDQLLPGGNYRLILSGNAGLTGLDGAAVNPDDQVLGDWTIAAAGLGLEDAVDIETPTSTVVTVTGSLDISNNLQDVKLYRFQLGDQHQTWRLGLQVDTGRIGSALTTTLSLFDDSGQVIDTSQVGRGAFPSDPYLFHGLKPGVYYVGISGAGNNPAAANGYDLVSHLSGNALPSVVSGNFNLSIVADSADKPTEVQTFFLNYADPNSATPTGFTLQFNGPINEHALRVSNKDAIAIVDKAGNVSTVHAIGYDEATSTVIFSFDTPIKQGQYRITFGAQGLTDLSGQPPVSRGFDPGTLAKFSVGPQKVKTDPFDLGAILAADALNGIQRTVHLAPGQTVTYRLLLTIPGAYDFQATYQGSAPKMFATIGGHRETVDAAPHPGELQRNLANLPTGLLTFIATGGPKGSDLVVNFRLPGGLLDQLLDSGVGLGSGLESRLISPSPISIGSFPNDNSNLGPVQMGSGTITTSSPIAGGNNNGSGSNGGSTSSNTTSSALGAQSPSTSGLLTAAPSLVGHPAILLEQVAPVGPTTASGTTSIAFNGTGLPNGLESRGQAGRANKPLTSGEMVTRPIPESDDALQVAAVDSTNSTQALENKPANADEAALAHVTTANLVDQGLALVAQVIGNRKVEKLEEATEFEGEPISSDSELIAAIEPPAEDALAAKEELDVRDMGSSLGVGVVSVGLVMFQTKLRRWIERRRQFFTVKRSAVSPTGVLPHGV
jgi:hypothetical protein